MNSIILTAGFELLALLSAVATPVAHQDIQVASPAQKFIFYSVLEGCFEDGVSNKDVDQVLMKTPKGAYFHFIYACPVCMSTIWALQVYRSRPEQFFSLKDGHDGTFGSGLSDDDEKRLFSQDPNTRLVLINELVKSWIARRMDEEHLRGKERTELVAALEKERQRGMEALRSFRANEHGPGNMEEFAPAYTNLTECAVCNGAVGKPMPLPKAK